MRYKLSIAFLLSALLLPLAAHAQTPPPTQVSNDCAHTPQYGGSIVCWDTTTHGWFFWDVTVNAFSAVSSGGSTITSGAGDFGAGTSQTGHVLTGVVVNGSNMAGSASIPDSALATPHSSDGVAGKVQLSDGSGNFTGVSMSQDVTMNGSGVATVGGILTKSIPSLPASSSSLTYDGVSAFSWQPFFPNPLNGLDTFLQGGATTNTAPTAGALPACLDSGGNHLNDPTSTHTLSCGTSIGALPANPAISSTNSVTGTAGSNQAVLFEDAPGWAHYLCDGSESDPNPAGTVNIQGVHCYPTLTVTNGNTLNVTFTPSTSGAATDKPNGTFVAYVQGACTIGGTIQANALTPNNINGYGGASGGGGGFGAANGTAGQNSDLPGGTGAAPIAAGGTGGTSGNTGSAGTTPSTSGIRDVLLGPPQWANCGGAAGGAGGSSGGAAGLGGGCIYLICGSVNFTGTLSATGGAGGAGGSNTGGGGGGGGGVVVLAGRTVTNSGTITLTGGNGGAIGTGTSTAGGAGGTGWSKVFTLN